MTAVPVYTRLALLWLAVTVLAGVWLRTALLWPAALQGVPWGNAVHAHSHLALFGWATMGLMAFVTGVAGVTARRLTLHAWVVGGASGAAFLGFLAQGYGPVTIAISTLQVTLWTAFVIAAWSGTAATDPAIRPWLRASLACLMLAAAAAILPGITTAMGTPPAVQRIAIELFLTVLVQGWLFVGAIAALVSFTPRSRRASLALAMLLAGMLPAALARVAGLDSAPLALLGRAGMLLTGAGSLLAAHATWPRFERGADGSAQAWIRIAVACVALKGIAELVAAAEPTGRLVLLRPVAVAYLHLVLLGVLTPALVATLAPRAHLGRRTAPLHAAGVAVMLGALVVMALPDALGLPAPALAGRPMHVAALGGGVMSALSLVTVAARSLAPSGAQRRPVPAGQSTRAAVEPVLD